MGMDLVRRGAGQLYDSHRCHVGYTRAGMMDSSSIGLSTYPTQLDPARPSYLEKQLRSAGGNYPKNEYEMVLVVDSRNKG